MRGPAAIAGTRGASCSRRVQPHRLTIRRRLGVPLPQTGKTSDFLDFVTYNQEGAEGEARGRERARRPWGEPPIWTEEAMGAMRLAVKRMFVRGGVL